MADIRKYDAFISYRHSELDKFVATTLQRKLEAFSLPKGVSSKTKKKRIERVFRDQDELPLSSNLSEPIHLALNNTDFLIVICTPRLPESKWCEEEISTFIKLYGREKILAVLAEGEPSESFPPLLTGEDHEETLPDGTKVTKHRNFEPLAADVRGKNNKEVRKKLDDAVLRIAASIFELNYDDLKQRHRERKIRRMLSIISSVAAAFMLFSAVCVGLMITIMNQSNMIMEQNTEIKEKSNEISQKNALINQQYEEAAKNLSVLTADNSIELLKRGRKHDALYMLRQVIPDSSSDTSIPYTPEAEAALVDALDVYAPVSELKIQNTYDSDYEIKSVTFSPDLTKMLTIDSGNYFKVFDIETGNLLFSKLCACRFTDATKKAAFCGNDYIIVAEDSGIHKYTISDSKDIILDSPNNFGQVLKGSIVRSNNKYSTFSTFLINDGSDIFLLDQTGQSVFSFSISDYSKPGSHMFLGEYSTSSDGKYLAFELSDSHDSSASILVLDSDTGETILHETYSAFGVRNILFDGYTLFYTVTSSGSLNKDSDVDSHSCFSYDCNSKKLNWKSEKLSYVTKIVKSANDNYLYLAGYSYIVSLDKKTGKEIYTVSLNESITDIYSINNSDYIYVATKTGDNYFYSCDTNTFSRKIPVNVYKENTNIIENTIVNTSGFFVVYENSNHVTRYVDGKSAHFSKYGDKVDGLVEYNASRNLYIFSEKPESYSVKSAKTNEILFSIDNVYSFYFIGDGSQSVIYESKENFTTYTYDFINNKTVSLDNLSFSGYSEDKKYGLSKDLNDHYTVYDLTTMTLSSEFDVPVDYDLSNCNLIPLDGTHILVNSFEYDYFEILYIENNLAKKIFSKYTGKLDKMLPAANANCFCVAYSTGMVEFYDYSSGKVDLINTSFNLEFVGSSSSFEYHPEKNIYIFSTFSKSYILNENFDPIASINCKINYLPSENLISYTEGDAVYAAPFYSYDELVKMADKELSGYCPPIRILKEYNFTPR